MTTIDCTVAWVKRELGRFADGTYLPVPVALDYPVGHCVHLSTTHDEPDYVAYTPSETYGEADRQVRLKFGRYLRKVFPALTDAEIQAHVTSLKSALATASAPATLHFATDTETINLIFETKMAACGSGMTSCMYGKFHGCTIRPYHVYANSPDVAVAYVMHNGGIIARSVVSTKDKTWVRAYSAESGDNDTDCGTIKSLLKDAGYTKNELTGNRLSKLNTNRIMLPYIDNGEVYVRDDGKYWMVVDDEDDADYTPNQTNGSASSCGSRCSCCNSRGDDCECSTCECCNERSADGCENCSFCQDCDGCTEHDSCNCVRCSNCEEIINPRRSYTTSCDCDRCRSCGDLMKDCDCERCDRCNDLTEDCECEDKAPVVTVPEFVTENDPVTVQQASDKLNRVYDYLRNIHGLGTGSSEYQLLVKAYREIWA
jgi:hypothetical protein